MSFPSNNTYSSAVQTAININPNVAAAGLEYDDSFSDVVSWIATTAIPFGAFVWESSDGFCSVPALTGSVTGSGAALRGIAMIDHQKASGEGYDIGDSVRVMRRGRIWALADPAAAIVMGATLFVRFAAGAGGTVLGAFAATADTGTASTPVSLTCFHGGVTGFVALDVG
jgi:hypothetical protein